MQYARRPLPSNVCFALLFVHLSCGLWAHSRRALATISASTLWWFICSHCCRPERRTTFTPWIVDLKQNKTALLVPSCDSNTDDDNENRGIHVYKLEPWEEHMASSNVVALNEPAEGAAARQRGLRPLSGCVCRPRCVCPCWAELSEPSITHIRPVTWLQHCNHSKRRTETDCWDFHKVMTTHFGPAVSFSDSGCLISAHAAR